MWLHKDYRKLKHLKVERVSGKKTIWMCHMSQCWPFKSLPNHTDHTWLFLLPSCHPCCSTPLKERAWHQNSAHFWWEQQKEASEAASLCLPCCVSLSQRHPAWRQRPHVTLQASAVLWALMRRVAEAWRVLRLQDRAKSVLFTTAAIWETKVPWIPSKSMPFHNCIIGKSGAGMSWRLWVSPPAGGTPPGRHSGTRTSRSGSVSLTQREAPAGPQQVWRDSTGKQVFQHKVRKMWDTSEVAWEPGVWQGWSTCAGRTSNSTADIRETES